MDDNTGVENLKSLGKQTDTLFSTVGSRVRLPGFNSWFQHFSGTLAKFFNSKAFSIE